MLKHCCSWPPPPSWCTPISTAGLQCLSLKTWHWCNSVCFTIGIRSVLFSHSVITVYGMLPWIWCNVKSAEKAAALCELKGRDGVSTAYLFKPLRSYTQTSMREVSGVSTVKWLMVWCRYQSLSHTYLMALSATWPWWECPGMCMFVPHTERIMV